MTDYSRMSYEELQKIANDDFTTAEISDEEYECLSVELWRKFNAERALAEQYSPAPALAGKPAIPDASHNVPLHIRNLEQVGSR